MVLLREIRKTPSLHNLTEVCGEAPKRPPPDERVLLSVRRKVGNLLGLGPKEVDQHHESSSWRWRIVEKVQQQCGDPDGEIAKWLREGAPVGIACPVVPGGLLPAITEEKEKDEDEVLAGCAYDSNHDSFDMLHDGRKPALEELAGLVDKGFAELCVDQRAAEEKLHGEDHCIATWRRREAAWRWKLEA